MDIMVIPVINYKTLHLRSPDGEKWSLLVEGRGRNTESSGVLRRWLKGKERKERILLCYYYTHPYSVGLLLVIQNFTISENACAVW
jgi:hypothetical protein